MCPQTKVRDLRAIHYLMLSLLLTIIACGEDRPAQRAPNVQPEARQAAAIHADADWPTFMHDISYHGISPDTTLRPPLALVWKFKTGGPVNSSPVVVDGTVYVGSDDHTMYALHARNWGVKWEFQAGDRIIYAPTVHEGTVYFSARDNRVYALDAATGAEKWEFQADGWINAPVVAFHQRIYLGCYDKKIYVLNAATGRKESQEYSLTKIEKSKYICSQGEFYPIDARNRAKRWRQGLPPSESWPATANNVVYIGARDNKLRAFDLATRREIWQFETDGWIDSSPAVAGGMLYIGSRDGHIYAFGNATDAVPQRADHAARKEGVVTRDRVRVYDQLNDKAEVITQLNEGRPLDIVGSGFIPDRKLENGYVGSTTGWFKVMLPNEQSGWISALDFIAVRWSEGLQVNDPLVKNVERLILPQKAEKPSWSPDGSIVVFFDNISAQSLYWKAKSVWLASSDGSNPRWIADGAFFNPRISWSGNSGWLALENLAQTERQVWIVRSNGTGLGRVTEGEAPAISPRGGMVAFIRRSEAATAVWVHSLEDNTEEKLAEIPIRGRESYAAYGYTPDITPPVWSPGGSRLAIGLDGYHYPDNYSRVAVVNASGGVIKEIAFRAGRIGDIAWSPDGSRLVYVSQEHSAKAATSHLDRKVHLINLHRSTREEIFENCEGIAWSLDGRYMAFIEENDCMGMRRKVWLLDVKNQERIQLLASRENIDRISWLADGRIVLLASPTPSKTAPRTRGWIVSVVSLTE